MPFMPSSLKTAARAMKRNLFKKTGIVARSCSCNHASECGDDFAKLPLGGMQSFVIINVVCYSEPLEKLTQSTSMTELRTAVAPVLPGGVLPEHEYLVLELAIPGQPGIKHRFYRLDFVNDVNGGTVTATLHPSVCSAVRRDIKQASAHLKQKWALEFGCRAAGCTHTLAAIKALVPQFEGQYQVTSNNCKAFTLAVLEALMTAVDGSACLDDERREYMETHIADGRLVNQAVHNVGRAGSWLTNAAHSFRSVAPQSQT